MPRTDVERPTVGGVEAATENAVDSAGAQNSFFLSNFFARKKQEEAKKPDPVQPDPAPAPQAGTVEGADDNDDLKGRVVSALQEIYDPEIPVNIYELGPDL